MLLSSSGLSPFQDEINAFGSFLAAVLSETSKELLLEPAIGGERCFRMAFRDGSLVVSVSASGGIRLFAVTFDCHGRYRDYSILSRIQNFRKETAFLPLGRKGFPARSMMKILQYVLWIVCGLFTAITAYSALVNIRNKPYQVPCFLIVCGSLALGFAIVCSVKQWPIAWPVSLAGSIAICGGCIMNNIRGGGKFQIILHTVRIVLCGLFVAGFAFL